MNKKLFSALILISFLAGLAPTALAKNETIAPTPSAPPASASPGPSSKAKDLFKNNKKVVDIACMQQAIEKRDTAIISGLDAYYAVTEASLQTRKETMKTAWAITDVKERRTALKDAWKTYRETIKIARNSFKTAKKSAWQQFYADRKTCGTAGTSDDPANSSVDNTL